MTGEKAATLIESGIGRLPPLHPSQRTRQLVRNYLCQVLGVGRVAESLEAARECITLCRDLAVDEPDPKTR